VGVGEKRAARRFRRLLSLALGVGVGVGVRVRAGCLRWGARRWKG
jgi:hypothetical protein